MQKVMQKTVDKIMQKIYALLGLDFDMDLHDEFFSQLKPDLYLGSRPLPEHIEDLKKGGITHIISCLDEAKRSQVAFLAEDFTTLFLPLKDGIHEDIASSFRPFFDFVSTAQELTPHAKFLVHCEVGVSRSASLALALIMKRESKRFFEVYQEVRLKRAKILPNIGFASQLQKLEINSGYGKRLVKGDISSLALYLHQICHAPADTVLLQAMLEKNNFNALSALQDIFGNEIPRVIQGVRL